MKNLVRFSILFSLVFVLSKIQMNGPTLYKTQGGSTTKIEEAQKFETCGEAYKIQCETNDSWDIESVN